MQHSAITCIMDMILFLFHLYRTIHLIRHLILDKTYHTKNEYKLKKKNKKRLLHKNNNICSPKRNTI